MPGGGAGRAMAGGHVGGGVNDVSGIGGRVKTTRRSRVISALFYGNECLPIFGGVRSLRCWRSGSGFSARGDGFGRRIWMKGRGQSNLPVGLCHEEGGRVSRQFEVVEFFVFHGGFGRLR